MQLCVCLYTAYIYFIFYLFLFLEGSRLLMMTLGMLWHLGPPLAWREPAEN